MARAMVDVDRVSNTGLMNPTYTTIGVDGVEFSNTGNEIVYIKAPTAAVITIVTPAVINGDLAIDDRTLSLGIGEEVFIANLNRRFYNTVDDTVQIDSDQTDTEILVLKK